MLLRTSSCVIWAVNTRRKSHAEAAIRNGEARKVYEACLGQNPSPLENGRASPGEEERTEGGSESDEGPTRDSESDEGPTRDSSRKKQAVQSEVCDLSRTSPHRLVKAVQTNRYVPVPLPPKLVTTHNNTSLPSRRE